MSSHGDVDEDDLSDVSMSAETDDSDGDDDTGKPRHPESVQQQSAIQNLDSALPGDISRKRKVPSDTFDPSDNLPRGHEETEGSKRLKLDLAPDLTLENLRTPEGRLPSDRSLLPAEIWHHIFTFMPPRALGRLLRLNKTFRAYLDPTLPSNSSNVASLSRSIVPLREPEVIWLNSRKLFRPWMPSPLEGMSELGMWKLACNFTCDFCGKRQIPISSMSTDQWHSGPGESGVRSIWAFAIRACAHCLQQRTVKVVIYFVLCLSKFKLISAQEIDLLLSSSVPSPLMSALPFVFLTNELHVVASTALQQGQQPSHIQISKYFYKPHVDDIKQEFFKVKSLGSGAAEEWVKGLDNRGKERRVDLARWERWEASGGVQRMRSDESVETLENIVKSKSQPSATLPPRPESFQSQPLSGLSRISVVTHHPPSNGMTHPIPPIPHFRKLNYL
jgi:hypothetical protein